MYRRILIEFFLLPCLLFSQSNLSVLKQYMNHIADVRLHVPDYCTFRYLLDIAIFDDKIFICVDSGFPVQIYKKDGNFVKTIGRSGHGPNEFPIQPQKISVNTNGGNLALTDGPLGITVYLIEGNKILAKSSDNFKGIDDIDFIGNNIITIHSFSADKHIKILEKNFEIIKQYIDVPKQSSVLNIVRSPYWAIQKWDKGIITHLSYPNLIASGKIQTESLTNIELLPDLNLINYNYLGDDYTLDIFRRSGQSPMKVYQEYSKIKWIITNGNFSLGKYISHEPGKDRSIKSMLFYLKKEILINETEIINDIGYRLIPFNDKLVFYDFIDFSETSDVSLSIWQLKN